MAESYSSFANFQEVVTQSAVVELFVSFPAQTIHSRVTYSLLVLSLSLSKITLDTLKLKVVAVSPGTFQMGEESPHLGTPLIITHPSPLSQGQTFQLTIESECGGDSPGLVWMTKEQTSGKQHPFVFTQFEPIYCRSLIPTQDVPCVKFPIEFRITVPQPLKAVTAALPTKEESVVPGLTTFHSVMKNPIPAYLIAFAVGNIAHRDIGPRSKVYAEPEVVESAAWEFADTESMLATAERLLSPYEWGKYDLLVLPPAFPYGGMENPTLTFMTPTVLAGDKSLTSIIAHELSHSWAGNLVTNKSWEHFWLNEGLTTFLENKIMRELMGDETTDIIVGNQLKSLEGLIESLMQARSQETRLITTMGDKNPDDVYSIVPYYKGMCFFVHLEKLVGGPSHFLPFLRSYFSHFAFKSLNSYDFRAYFTSNFPSVPVDWDTWLHGEGMPPTLPDISLTANTVIQELIDRFLDPDFSPKSCDIASWSSPQLCLFLKKVSAAPLPQHLRMATAYGFSASKNCEVKVNWLSIVIKLQAKQYYPEVVEMLGSQGRMKYVRSLFALLATAGERDLVKSTYEANKAFYSLILKRLLVMDHPWLEN